MDRFGLRRAARYWPLMVAACLTPLAALAQSDRPLAPGDIVHVETRRRPEYSATRALDPQGRLRLTDVGYVELAGLSPREAAERIEGELGRVLRRPRVTVRRREFAPEPPPPAEAGTVLVAPLEHADARGVAAALRPFVGPGVTLTHDEAANAVVARGPEGSLADLGAVAARLDAAYGGLSNVTVHVAASRPDAPAVPAAQAPDRDAPRRSERPGPKGESQDAVGAHKAWRLVSEAGAAAALLPDRREVAARYKLDALNHHRITVETAGSARRLAVTPHLMRTESGVRFRLEIELFFGDAQDEAGEALRWSVSVGAGERVAILERAASGLPGVILIWATPANEGA